MNLAERQHLSDRQRRWVNAWLGREMSVSTDDHPGLGGLPRGVVVDFKVDVAGVGVYFVLDLGDQRVKGERWYERYRKLPPR